MNIEAYAFTKNHEVGDFARSKTLRSMVSYGGTSEDWSFDIRLFTNSRGTVSQTVYEFSAGTFVQGEDVLWDTFLFDKFMWDFNSGYTNVVVDFMKPKMLTQSNVNLIKVKIENVSANTQFSLYGISLSGYAGNKYIYD